jgi:predicted enzyme related to lactoylglutathione lyase
MGAALLRGLTTVRFQTDDLPTAKRWYADLLDEEPHLDYPGYAQFRLGDYQHELGLVDRRNASDAGWTIPSGAIVYWHVDNVQAALERLLAMGATPREAAADFGGGYAGASVVDPFGNILGIMHSPHYLQVLGATDAQRQV